TTSPCSGSPVRRSRPPCPARHYKGDPVTDIALCALDDPALAQLRVDVLTELERRETLASAPERADRIARDYLGASGTAEGEEWVQPSGAHDSYPQGWEVVHEGVRYRSLIPGNVW